MTPAEQVLEELVLAERDSLEDAANRRTGGERAGGNAGGATSDRREPSPESGEPAHHGVAFVAEKQLVASISRQRDRNALTREAAQVVRRNRRGIAEGLIMGGNDLGQDLQSVGCYHLTMVFGAEVASNRFCRRRLVMARLLEGSKPVLALLAENPFPDAPPLYIRSSVYRYEFTSMAEDSRDWWVRERRGSYCPVVTLIDGDLRSVEIQ